MGDGALLYKNEIQQKLGSLATFAPSEICFPRAAAIGMLAIKEWQSNNFLDPGLASPTYIRPSDAEICYKKKETTTVCESK